MQSGGFFQRINPLHRPIASAVDHSQSGARLERMKEAYIAAKERWARKMAGTALPEVRSVDRLPPGQRQVHNFPVLDCFQSVYLSVICFISAEE